MSCNESTFKELVTSYHKILYQYAFWLTRDSSVAEDLVQETFLRAWRGFDSLQKVESVKPWLITILKRENARRFQKKTFEFSDFDLENIADTNGQFTYSFEMETLRHYIEQLPDKYREPLVMQLVLGSSQEEISSALDMPVNTVGTRLRRARLQLKSMILEGEGNSMVSNQ